MMIGQARWPIRRTDGCLVAAYSRFILTLLEAETGEEIALLDSRSNFDATVDGDARVSSEEIALLDSRSNGGFHSCCISVDGTLLAAASDTHVHVWNLQQLRDRLARISLDW